jgi:O-antigen/teichoic acid export membrane protein
VLSAAEAPESNMKEASSLALEPSLPDVPSAPAPALSGRKDYFNTVHLMSDLRGHALRGTSITLVAQIVAFGISTIGTVILARLLTPHDFGLVAMVLSASLLLQGFGTNGFIEATIQREEIDHKQISNLCWINVGINLMLTLAFMALAPAIAWFYKEPLLKPIVVAIAVSILFGGTSTQHQALLRRHMEFYKIAACDIVAMLASVGVAIALAYRGWGYWALVARWVMAPAATTAAAWAFCGWRPGLPSRGAGARPMLGFAFNTYGNFVLNYFSRTVDKVLVGRFHGSQALGFYDRAYQFSMLLPSQLYGPLNSVGVPAFSRLASDPAKYRRTFLKLFSIMAFVCMPASAVLTLTGKDVILLMLGPQWNSAGEIFSIFGVSIGVMMLYYKHPTLHISLGTPDRWLRWAIVSSLATVLLIVMGLPFGARGVAAAYSASFYILIGPALWYAGRPIELKVSSLVSGVWKYSVAALVAGLVCWFLTDRLAVTAGIVMHLNVFVRILVTSALCTSIYLVLVLLLYRSFEPFSQFIKLVRDMIPGMASRR